VSNSLAEHLAAHKTEFSHPDDLAPLIESLADRRVVLLGEASHGTHEYYLWRARISRRLLEAYGFDFVAVEGDWPACYQLNRHVKGYPDAHADTQAVLRKFTRWPSWMWANWEIYEWASWQRRYNAGLPAHRRTGFYGLDVYSLWESLDAIMRYLEREDPAALVTARKAVRCFDPHRGEDGQHYALSTRLVPEGCSEEVNALLTEIRQKAPSYNSDPEHAFSTEQNAYVAKNAEAYYRVMMQGNVSTWNLRDRHMMDTLDRLLNFHGPTAKGIVWAHNTHIGDAAHTDMASRGLFNIGELARQEYGAENVALVGFGSYRGSVIAGREWGARREVMPLPPGRAGSWEHYCHQAGDQFYLRSDELRRHPTARRMLPHRAVGVVYDPTREKYGNYVPTVLPDRYDIFLFFDESRALNPIDITVAKPGRVPDTYPFGL
jgi:erythromycin esterase-like protein